MLLGLVSKLIVALAVVLGLFAASSSAQSGPLRGPYVVPPVKLSASNYHRWAHYNWVWLHNGLSNQVNVTNLVQGYLDNHIPIGAVNIDSTWATEFNNFEVDTKKFPDIKGLFDWIHDNGLRVIMWATSMVNVENPDYQMCVDKQYLVRDRNGKVFPLHWWHGDGGLLDYSNPEAVAWWHSKMDQVLDIGLDGFKCDGTDPYIDEYILTGGAYGYQNKTYTYREYADDYYRDFFYYTREKRGDAGLIMSRPTDCLTSSVTKGCTNFSPKDVMYSGWVGDDDATFNGLRGCARKVIYSAWSGYANYGCDIGGYRGSNTLNPSLFVRWAQFGAFLPLMENGGGGEHRPWMYSNAVLDTYRRFAEEHHRLAPYLLTTGSRAVAGGHSSIVPLAEKPDDVNPYRNPHPSTYSYTLGSDILVHPVMFDIDVNKTDSNGFDLVKAEFPQGSDWLDWWRPHDGKLLRKGGSKAILTVPETSYPVYVRRGALLPLQVSPTRDAAVEFTWFGPKDGDSASADSLEPASYGNGITSKASLTASSDGSGSILEATISAHSGGAGFAVNGISEPADVIVEAGALSAGCKHIYTRPTATLTVYCVAVDFGVKITATGVTSTL